MNAGDLARSLEKLKTELNNTKVGVNNEKNTVGGTKSRVDSIIASANGNGIIQHLRGAADEYRRASEEVRAAHDALSIAQDALRGYLEANFRPLGGGNGAGSELQAITAFGFVHTELSLRAQKRAAIKKALFAVATTSISAIAVGVFTGALIAGAPLMAAAGAAVAVTAVPDAVGFAIAACEHAYELRGEWSRGTVTRDDIKKQIIERAGIESLEYGIGKIPVVGNLLGIVLNIKDLVSCIMDLREES